MRRAGHLFEPIIEMENLRRGFWRAARGKRQRREVIAFTDDLDDRLREMAAGMRSGTLRAGSSTIPLPAARAKVESGRS